jgi:predicted RNase H-like HicB family nuclease
VSKFRVVLIPEVEGGYSVVVPALPGCLTQGETRDEAMAMAKEAIALHIESLRAHGDPVPVDNTELATVVVEAPAA